ncbi:hypothetical protein GDO78_010154 [Eleutherodactylus coqui]|uniref:Palmitoyltransferase n=1 Tax=Eleutherodactylus coqui TaxID=57060 RepID=A0A8J6F5Y2_ELECQ|nr:hypothetical protein GDO78_010154 [Eleutherodactylus coqui]
MAGCVQDPCGLLCVLLTYLSLGYADYVILRHILLHSFPGSIWGPLHAVGFNLVVFLLLACHTRAVFSDPGLTSLYAMGLVLATWLWPTRKGSVEDTEKAAPAHSHVQTVHCILLLVESILFGLFVTVIFYDQIVSIITDETPIEQLRNRLLKEANKEVSHTRKPKMALLREVFGRGYMICWLFPCNSPPSSGRPAYSYLPDYDV